MTDFTKRTALEAATYEVLANYIAKREAIKGWSSEALSIQMVFRAMYTSSLTVARIAKVAEALGGVIYSSSELEAELNAMVKAKALRRRKAQGAFLYEVRYDSK